MEQRETFGIYLNKREQKAVRINSPHWIPSGPDWVFLSPEVNITLLQIRQLAKKRKLVANPDKLEWA